MATVANVATVATVTTVATAAAVAIGSVASVKEDALTRFCIAFKRSRRGSALASCSLSFILVPGAGNSTNQWKFYETHLS